MDGLHPAKGSAAASDELRVIAIAGAGFCGTALAIQLLRQASNAQFRIVLVDPRTVAA